jgi:hypothetical protein
MLEINYVLSFVFPIVILCLQGGIMRRKGNHRRFKKQFDIHLVRFSHGPWMVKPHMNDLFFECVSGVLFMCTGI